MNNTFVLKIGNIVDGIFDNYDELVDVLADMVGEDFDWDEFKNNEFTWYDFGTGEEEEVEYYVK